MAEKHVNSDKIKKYPLKFKISLEEKSLQRQVNVHFACFFAMYNILLKININAEKINVINTIIIGVEDV